MILCTKDMEMAPSASIAAPSRESDPGLLSPFSACHPPMRSRTSSCLRRVALLFRMYRQKVENDEKPFALLQMSSKAWRL